MTPYPYTECDLLKTREHYFYSALQGPDFFDAYRAARKSVLDTLPKGDAHRSGRPTDPRYPAPGTAAIRTTDLLDALEARPDADWLERLVQRFEVTKRLYARYDGRLRKPEGDFHDLQPYARLSRLLADQVARSRDLKWLNTLLKLNDLLCSQPAPRRETVAGMLSHSLTIELAAIDALLARPGASDDA